MISLLVMIPFGLQTYDDIGGIYDSCDDYNYDSNPADDI